MTAIQSIIMKFGGTSVEDAHAFSRVGRIVCEQQRSSASRLIVIVSAMSGVTDALLKSVQAASEEQFTAAVETLQPHLMRHAQVAEELLSDNARRFIEAQLERAWADIETLLRSVAARKMPRALLQDVIVSYGERLSASLLAHVLQAAGAPAQYVDARRCVITDAEHGRATPLIAETARRTRANLEPLLESLQVPVLGGFIAATADGATTTLGRGGSDYTAALIGAALKAQEVQIWTDVPGVLTADPRVIKQARTIARMSYAEAAELAYFGAKVLHPKTIQPAIEHRIPVRIYNSRAPEEPGTLVNAETEGLALPMTIKAIAHKVGITTLQITSARMLGAYGFLRALFEIFDRHHTAVDIVTTSEVSVSLSLDDASELPHILPELRQLGTVEVETDRAIVCIVGEGLSRTPGVAARAFKAVGDVNVSIISQGASSINLTLVVDQSRVVEVVTRLHKAFFEEIDEQLTTPDTGEAATATHG